jgi:hypothetical protein
MHEDNAFVFFFANDIQELGVVCQVSCPEA